MSVIIRLQNLPWSANALDIRNFFRGLSIPEGGVHIVGGELGDAFIAFSTDEDARQAMMLDGGKIKEIQVKLLLSSRSEMHKVIETARQTVPILSLTAAAPAPAPVPSVAPIITPTSIPAAAPTPPVINNPFTAALGSTLSNFGIPGIGNPQEIPQPAVIEPPAPMISPPIITPDEPIEKDDDTKSETKRSKDKDRRRTRSRSRSRDRDRKDRKRDRRDRSRSRERRRRDRSRSRSRDRRDRKRDRKDRSRSRDRSPSRRSRDRRNMPERKSPTQEKTIENQPEPIGAPPPPSLQNVTFPPMQIHNKMGANGPMNNLESTNNRFSDPSIAEAFNKLHELGKKRNPNAFQGDQPQNGGSMRFQGGRGGGNMNRGGANFRRDESRSLRGNRFNDNNENEKDCCVAIRNAPTHTSYGDVRRFFPFMIDKHGIKMINDHMGRRTGTIFVRFCDPRSKQLALQRRNNELKGAEVIVEALDDEAYESAIDSFLPFREENEEEQPIEISSEQHNERNEFTILKLTELPHFVKEHDIIKAFSEFSLLSIMLNDCRITRTKIAFVQFAKPEDARLAFDRKDRYLFGKRQPTVVPCPDEEYEKEKSKNEAMRSGIEQQRNNNEPQPRPPEPAGPRDPRQRRQQFEGAPTAGPTPVNTGGVPAFFPGPFVQGQQFATPFPTQQFGGFPGGGNADPRTAAANWANRPNFPNQMGVPQVVNKPLSRDFDDEPLDCVLMKGLPPEATDRTIVSFLSDTGAVPARIHLMLNTNGMPSGDCFCEFRSSQEARMAASKHGANLDGCRITVDLVSRAVVEEALEGPKPQHHPQMNMHNEGLLGPVPAQPQFYDNPRGGYGPRGGFRGRGFERGGFDRGGFDRGGFRGGFDSGRAGFRGRGFGDRARGFDRGRGRGFSRGRGGFENGRDMRDDSEPDPALEDFGAPGCVVSMENVPFRATVDDILQFFSEFDLSQDDIIRRYNDRGQPTGDARVAFRTPFDAQRAVKTRHMDTIHDRRINLTII